MDETEGDAPAFIYIFRFQVSSLLICFRTFLIYISSGAMANYTVAKNYIEDGTWLAKFLKNKFKKK